MDITSVLAAICSAAVFLAWFVLPHSVPEAPAAGLPQMEERIAEAV